MNIDELIQYDASFSIPGFIATADNTYMMLQTAVMLGNLSHIMRQSYFFNEKKLKLS